MKTIFQVNGKPFFPLAGQAHNSSAYTPEELEITWRACAAMSANTGELPVYWEQVEPADGSFDFGMVDHMLAGAEARGLKLVLLWFGTWKNGTMKYSPQWVKNDAKRFWRVLTHDGVATPVLSEHCPETLAADSRAFAALLRHLRQKDRHHTVLAVQVQNEPGMRTGAQRDHGEQAERTFQSPVPAELIDKLAGASSSYAFGVWQQAGGKTRGNWSELFGAYRAPEFFSAWHIARYINAVAAAGKKEYPLPMYVNVWNDHAGFDIAGISYPSGGPTSKVLDIWKWTAPEIALIAPDIYSPDTKSFRMHCGIFSRPDNPLFIPESASNESGSRHIFYAIADFHAIGYGIFGIESMIEADGSVKPAAQAAADSARVVRTMLPLILRHHGTDRIHAVVQDEGATEQYIDLGAYAGLVRFESHPGDHHHRRGQRGPERGRGLVVHEGEGEFFVAGAGFKLLIVRKEPLDERAMWRFADPLSMTCADYATVDEGQFDENGAWKVTRKRSGDESDWGIWVWPDVGAVRVVMAHSS